MINFLAEISTRYDGKVLPTPSNEFPRQYNIYYLDISPHPTESYWIDWGGWYDNFTDTMIELYYSTFLRRVYSADDLINTVYSLYVSDDLKVYFNIPVPPWFYPEHSQEAMRSMPFLTSALNPDDPSNNVLRNIKVLTNLSIPDITSKLSDNISGVTLYQGFNITLTNNNGFFDDEIKWNIFNTPVHVKKTRVKNPSYNDFVPIKYGLVETLQANFENYTINVSDVLKTMENSVCDLILRENFPIEIDFDEKLLNKNIPIVYGRRKVKLEKINETMYLIAEYVNDIYNVFDKEGNIISTLFWRYDRNTNILTVDEEADSVIIMGYPKNNLGSVIIDLITRKANIPFTNAFWNIDEIERYLELAPNINITIDNGNVKGVIQDLLKNDIAYLIQQNNGKLTIRKYGEEYKTHYIKNWTTTNKPEKTWGNSSKQYFSSCVINYDRWGNDEVTSLLYNEREFDAEKTYRRILTKTFDTNLYIEQQAYELAHLLSDRYTNMRQTIRLPTGIETSEMELLDTVEIDLTINGRKISDANRFMIKEINPAQDILTLEELDKVIDPNIYLITNNGYRLVTDKNELLVIQEAA